MREEMNAVKNRITKQKVNETKSLIFFLKKNNKIETPVAILIKNKIEGRKKPVVSEINQKIFLQTWQPLKGDIVNRFVHVNLEKKNRSFP